MNRFAILALSLLATVGLTACSDDVTGPEPGTANSVSLTEIEALGRDSSQGAPARSDQTIAELAEEQGLTLLLAAVGYIADTNPDSPLVAGLLNKDQFTVFAPTDEAFVTLVEAVTPLLDPDILENEGPFAAIDDLLGAGTIEAVVSYHVTEGRRAANSVVPRRGERKIETLLEGGEFTVSPGGMITAVGNSATIENANFSASNGIVHVIDAVILPIDLGL
jgi:uncharacterized surface protein with fasciclin (FAS1) repeats